MILRLFGTYILRAQAGGWGIATMGAPPLLTSRSPIIGASRATPEIY